jgi:hypothetical protein
MKEADGMAELVSSSSGIEFCNICTGTAFISALKARRVQPVCQLMHANPRECVRSDEHSWIIPVRLTRRDRLLIAIATGNLKSPAILKTFDLAQKSCESFHLKIVGTIH